MHQILQCGGVRPHQRNKLHQRFAYPVENFIGNVVGKFFEVCYRRRGNISQLIQKVRNKQPHGVFHFAVEIMTLVVTLQLLLGKPFRLSLRNKGRLAGSVVEKVFEAFSQNGRKPVGIRYVFRYNGVHALLLEVVV